MHADTIYAPASAQGKAGVAVVRVSGPQAGQAMAMIIGGTLPAPRRAALRLLRDPRQGGAIDRGLVLWFPAPHSFTGEDVGEMHIHGGRATLAALLAALAGIGQCRLAEPGEFSRRAFENGRLDLTEAEAIADLVAAETEQQRRQALRQLDGELGALYEDWRQRLLGALGRLEADIDFPDEDLPHDMAATVRPMLAGLGEEIAAHLADNRRGERLRHGLHVAIIGAPNVGKSSLLNALARREAAIVSETAGTTRDIIEVHLDLGGWPVVLADTAGLRASDNEIEREGVRRAEARAAHADLRVVLLDASAPELAPRVEAAIQPGDVVVYNKSDLLMPADPGAALSVKTGAGLDRLLAKIEERVGLLMQSSAGPPLTRERHRLALQECVQALQRALAAGAGELAAEDVRLAARALGRITGRVGVEDMLDIVFREFCIGK